MHGFENPNVIFIALPICVMRKHKWMPKTSWAFDTLEVTVKGDYFQIWAKRFEQVNIFEPILIRMVLKSFAYNGFKSVHVTLIEGCCARYEGQEQVTTFRSICGM